MFTAVIGGNSALRKAVEQARRISTCQTPVLIVGEAGTGKELLARAIHHRSPRRGLPFLVVNCATLSGVPEDDCPAGSIAETASLAFTKLFELILEAQGGTLYFKNIDALGFALQEAMIRFLVDNNNSSLPATSTGPMIPRILAATIIPLDSLGWSKGFHGVFYEWITQCAITIPPLRERGKDLVLLARHFAQVYGRQAGHARFDLSDASLSRLLAYDWPGNVQELEETIVRTCAASCLDAVQSEPPRREEDERMQSVRREAEPVSRSGLSLRQTKARAIEQFEREYLTCLLSIHRGNVSSAARSAGTERRAFQRLLRKYGLERADFLESA